MIESVLAPRTAPKRAGGEFFLPLGQLLEGVEGQGVGIPAEAGDAAAADGGDQRGVAELLAGLGIGEVHLDDGDADGADGVAQGHGGMRIGAGVEDYPGRPGARVVQGVDQRALVVRLGRAQFQAQLSGQAVQARLDLRQRELAIDARLAFAEQVQIGSIEQ